MATSSRKPRDSLFLKDEQPSPFATYSQFKKQIKKHQLLPSAQKSLEATAPNQDSARVEFSLFCEKGKKRKVLCVLVVASRNINEIVGTSTNSRIQQLLYTRKSQTSF
jgi:hypothetical protein